MSGSSAAGNFETYWVPGTTFFFGSWISIFFSFWYITPPYLVHLSRKWQDVVPSKETDLRSVEQPTFNKNNLFGGKVTRPSAHRRRIYRPLSDKIYLPGFWRPRLTQSTPADGRFLPQKNCWSSQIKAEVLMLEGQKVCGLFFDTSLWKSVPLPSSEVPDLWQKNQFTEKFGD